MAIPRRRRPLDEVSFQLAPMIDMTFLLLIFFMVTTRISKEQVKMEIQLPQASHGVIPSDLSNRDILNIDANGQFWVGNVAKDDQALAAYLKQRFIDTPPLRIYVRADSETPGKRIKQVMKLAAEAGAIDVIFGSYRKEGAR